VIRPGRYRLVAERSRASVTAYAPGHRFVADGSGLEGLVEIGADRVLSAHLTFPLARLDAHDALRNHELRRFLELDRAPIAKGELASPASLSSGRIAISIGPRRMETAAAFEGEPPSVTARFQLTFTGLGYQPPKLLFLKVKDAIDVEVTANLDPVA
jgi:hypothetical protein